VKFVAIGMMNLNLLSNIRAYVPESKSCIGSDLAYGCMKHTYCTEVMDSALEGAEHPRMGA